ncbi:MAG: DNA-binding protein, partial [Myxococcales bacterium]|nr:DNA-binding protein [Myxococcales bacterium]
MTETAFVPEIALTVVAWLATYLVHSTLLIGTVWAFTRWCSLDSLTRSLLWKLALVGGLFTATLQTGLGVRPWLGQVAVASEDEAAVAAMRWEARPPGALLGPLALHVGRAASSDEWAAEIEARAEAIEVRAEAIEARAEAMEAVVEAVEAAHEHAEGFSARAEAQLARDAAQAERDAAQAERDAAQAERDALQAERDALQASVVVAVDERSAGFMVFAGPSSDCRGPACPWVHVVTDRGSGPAPVTAAPTEPTRGPWEVL